MVVFSKKKREEKKRQVALLVCFSQLVVFAASNLVAGAGVLYLLGKFLSRPRLQAIFPVFSKQDHAIPPLQLKTKPRHSALFSAQTPHKPSQKFINDRSAARRWRLRPRGCCSTLRGGAGARPRCAPFAVPCATKSRASCCTTD